MTELHSGLTLTRPRRRAPKAEARAKAERICQLHNEGYTPRQITELTGWPTSTVYWHLAHLAEATELPEALVGYQHRAEAQANFA